MHDSAYWIGKLHLAPHPEGGYFVETYRSPQILATPHLPRTYDAPRSLATAIVFLLEGDDFSAFHRLKGDEIWHHYAGGPLTLHMIDPEGTLTTARLGDDPEGGGSPQVIVPAGCWLAANVDGLHGYGLVGCTMAPGFAFADLELGRREELVRSFPPHRALIERFTRRASGE
jgi:uncharacterized protein